METKQTPEEKSVNYMQVVDQSDEEKMAVYMKMPKEQMIKMLIECNKVLSGYAPLPYSQSLQSEIDRLKAVCDSMAERNRKLEDALRNCNSALEICRDLINNDEFSDNINSGIAFNEQLLTPNNE